MIYLLSSFILGIIFFIFRGMGNFDMLLPFEWTFLFPLAFYLLSQVLRIIRLQKVQEEELSTLVGVNLFSESLGNLLFPFFKDLYALFLSVFLVKRKAFFMTRLFVLRVIDISFYFITTFFIFTYSEPFIKTVRFDLLIYLLSLSILLIWLRKYIEGIELASVFLYSIMIWSLEVISFFSFLLVTNKEKEIFWKEAIHSFLTVFSVLTDPHVKWFSLILIVLSIPILLIIGKRKL